MYNEFMEIGIDTFSNLRRDTESLKKKAIKEYHLALKMPRKKKKQAKKSALLLYSIACWGESIYSF